MKLARWLISSSLWIWAAQASAEDGAPSSRFVVAAPDVKLEASSDGKADLKVGTGVRFAADEIRDVTIRVTADTSTSSGLATLVSLSPPKASLALPWNLGLNASLFQFTGRGQQSNFGETKRKAWDACIQRCARAAENPSSEAFAADREGFCKTAAKNPAYQADPSLVEYDELCKDGQRVIEDLQKAHLELAIHEPQGVLNAGAKLGQASFSYLQPSATDATQLTPQKDTPLAYSFGVSGVWLPPGARAHGDALTLEALAGFGTSFEESSTVAHWCVPGGTVTTDTGDTGAAQICKDTPVGAPTKSTAFTLQAFLGYLRETEDTWRLAAGVSAELPFSGTRKISALVPVLLSFTSDDVKYKGLIRLTPGMTWSWPPGSTTAPDVALTVTVAILGQRSLFSESFDAL